MAKKKRKRKRRAEQPPRPGATVEHLVRGPAREPEERRPDTGPEPQAEAAPAPDRRQAAIRRREKQRRRQRLRLYGIIGVVVLAIVGVFAFRQIQNQRVVAAHERIAAGAGCGEVQDVGGLDRTHWAAGSPLPTYETSPPAGGPHHPVPLSQNLYTEPLSTDINESPSIYQAVHSLEHGYIVVWTNDLTADEQSALEREIRVDARKVIVAPYPDLGENKLAMSAWGKLQVCDSSDPEVVRSFIELFREKTAPEATAQ